jgi:CheY-like chemotaxis protein
MNDYQPNEVLFILVDDDDINNLISHLIVKNTWVLAETVSFSEPAKALQFLQEDFNDGTSKPAVLLLNIHMPSMTGWKFLDHFANLQPAIKSRIQIFMLSSSSDPRDQELSRSSPYVSDFLPKPLTIEMVVKIRSTLRQ